MLPPLAELNVGPFVNVPLFPRPDTSFQVVDPETYEFRSNALKLNTNPSVIIFGPLENAILTINR